MINIALTGINAMQKDLDAIAHNISNVETVGYKKMDNVFSDVYTNAYMNRAPTLPGFSGVYRPMVMQDFSGGTLRETNNSTDMAITGSGFFALKDAQSNMPLFSRNGIFHIDNQYRLVDYDNNRLQGFKCDELGQVIGSSLEDINIRDFEIRREGRATTLVDSLINLDGSREVVQGWGYKDLDWGLMNEPLVSPPDRFFTPFVKPQTVEIDLNGQPHTIQLLGGESAPEIAAMMPDKLEAKAKPNRVQLTFGSITKEPSYYLEIQIGNAPPFKIAANQMGLHKNLGALITNHLEPGLQAIDVGDGSTVIIEDYNGNNINISNVGSVLYLGPDTAFTFEAAPIMSNGKPGTTYNLLEHSDLKMQVVSALDVKSHYSIETVDYVSSIPPKSGGITSDIPQNMSIPQTGLPFNPEDPNSYTWVRTTNVYDSIGTERELTTYFIKRSKGEWLIKYALDGDIHKVITLPVTCEDHYIYFNETGEIDTTILGNDGYFKILINPGDNILPTEINIDYSTMSQYADDSAVYRTTQNGYPPGYFEQYAINNGGIVESIYSNGEKIPQMLVALAIIPSVQNLLSIGNGWEYTLESGEPIYSPANVGNAGDIKTNFLETSNVDLLRELVDLVVAQRNYQANAKSLKVDETVTQALLSII